MLRIVSGVLVALALTLVPALAGDLTGTSVTPIAPLPVLDSPPGGFFKGAGKEIGTAKPGQFFIVLQQLTVPSIVGSQDWLQVKSQSGEQTTGWIYLGPSDGSTVNVKSF